MPETCQGGLKPVFGTEPSTIFVFRKGRNDVEEQAHRGAGDRRGQANGSRPELLTITSSPAGKRRCSKKLKRGIHHLECARLPFSGC